MPPVIIFGIVLSLALGLIFIVYSKQSAEKKRIEHIRYVRSLGDRARNLMFLMEEIPAHYLDHSMRVFLARSVVELMEQQHEAEPDDKTTKQLETAKQQLESATKNKNVATVPITDVKTANNVRKNLKLLHKHITVQYQEKKISPAMAQGFLKQMRKAFAQTIIDVYISAGKKAEREAKPKIAALHYRRVITEMGKNNQTGDYTDQILATKKHVDELEESAAKQEQQQRLEGTQNGDQLSKEFDKMMEEEDQWKKKQLYD